MVPIIFIIITDRIPWSRGPWLLDLYHDQPVGTWTQGKCLFFQWLNFYSATYFTCYYEEKRFLLKTSVVPRLVEKLSGWILLPSCDKCDNIEIVKFNVGYYWLTWHCLPWLFNFQIIVSLWYSVGSAKQQIINLVLILRLCGDKMCHFRLICGFIRFTPLSSLKQS